MNFDEINIVIYGQWIIIFAINLCYIYDIIYLFCYMEVTFIFNN